MSPYTTQSDCVLLLGKLVLDIPLSKLEKYRFRELRHAYHRNMIALEKRSFTVDRLNYVIDYVSTTVS